MEIFYNAFPLWTSIHYKLYYAKNIIIRDGINSLRLTGSVKNELVAACTLERNSIRHHI